MRTVPGLLRTIGIPLLAGCAIFPAATDVLANNGEEQQKPVVVTPAESDREAARNAKLVYRKAWTGHKVVKVDTSKLVSGTAGDRHTNSAGRGAGGDSIRFPGDLTYNGGAVVDFAESHDIYMLPNGKCPVSKCWGDPERFLADLGKSDFIHITDQYVGQQSSDRYTLGQSSSTTFTPPGKPLIDAEMQVIVHAAASKTGQTGYRHIYHVFVPAGQDVCMDSTFAVCASNVFCAYHASADFDIGHVLYTVEPFAAVDGCEVKPGTPNRTLIDSTNNVLSHELIETITDPDGDAWWNNTAVGLFGEEIGDECSFVVFVPNHAFSDPDIIIANGRKYALQPEYNNRQHGCTNDE
jgi:hypothetical protein